MPLPVPVPRTFSVNEVQVPAYLNSIRDALNFLVNPPIGAFTQGTTQTLSSGWTVLTFDQTTVDTYGGHSNTVNPSRYTAQVVGWYVVAGTAVLGNNATGGRGCLVGRNSVHVPGSGALVQAANGLPTGVSDAAWPVFLNVGDFVEVSGIQGSGGSLSTTFSGDLASSMSVLWQHA